MEDAYEIETEVSNLANNIKRCANCLIKSGFSRYGTTLFKEVDQWEAWYKEDKKGNEAKIFSFIRSEIENINNLALKYYENKLYEGRQKYFDMILDYFEEIFRVFPTVKPGYWIEDTDYKSKPKMEEVKVQ